MAVSELLRADTFASRYLARAVFRLAAPERAGEALAALPPDVSGPVLIEARVATGDVAVLSRLTAVGFAVVDTNVQLDMLRDQFVPDTRNQVDWHIRTADRRDRNAVGELAADHLVTSRFHADPHIEPEQARALKCAWAGNFFDATRGDRLFVAERDGIPAGFLLVLERGTEGVIDLIALGPVLRGTGAAAGLVQEWLMRAPGLARLVVGTQLSNVRSLRAYGRMGFRVCGSTHVLHLHGPADTLRSMRA